MMVGVRDLRLAQSPEDAGKAINFFRARLKSATEYADHVMSNVTAAEKREGLQRIKGRLGPLRSLNGAMQEMADGSLGIAIPGANRGDEIGDIAKTVTVIRENAEREAIRKQEEDHRKEAQLEAERKEAMYQLANAFEQAVGGIIETVSSASTELEAAAGTLTRTAETTQSLSGTVAAASEEASANVQSVASATNEMAARRRNAGHSDWQRQLASETKITKPRRSPEGWEILAWTDFS
jgi:methyl-accepting chemotaxis protein